ncbi:MAG TPA: RDD family protein [Steroidobacteraceae bacterium]|nr:RDD family protein [Steroidobacteraceae bacterium]
MSTHGARDLIIDSVTGVELALPIAGPGARCYAFLIDWHVRAILFAAWYAVAAIIYNGRWSFAAPLDPDAKWFMFVVTPAATLYFLYHFVLEIAMHGRTPGKRLAGVRLVSRDGGPPGVGALLIRNVFRLVDSLPVLYGVGLVVTLVTREHVRIGDMAAGTLLTYDRSEAVPPAHTSEIELIRELLLRWHSLEQAARHDLAVILLSRHGIDANDPADAALRAQLDALARDGHK